MVDTTGRGCVGPFGPGSNADSRRSTQRSQVRRTGTFSAGVVRPRSQLSIRTTGPNGPTQDVRRRSGLAPPNLHAIVDCSAVPSSPLTFQMHARSDEQSKVLKTQLERWPCCRRRNPSADGDTEERSLRADQLIRSPGKNSSPLSEVPEKSSATLGDRWRMPA